MYGGIFVAVEHIHLFGKQATSEEYVRKKANFSSSDNSKQTLQTTLFFLGSKEKQLCFLLLNQKYLQTYHLYP